MEHKQKKGYWIERGYQKGKKCFFVKSVECSECGTKAPMEITENAEGFIRINRIYTDECPHCSIKMERTKREVIKCLDERVP